MSALRPGASGRGGGTEHPARMAPAVLMLFRWVVCNPGDRRCRRGAIISPRRAGVGSIEYRTRQDPEPVDLGCRLSMTPGPDQRIADHFSIGHQGSRRLHDGCNSVVRGVVGPSINVRTVTALERAWKTGATIAYRGEARRFPFQDRARSEPTVGEQSPRLHGNRSSRDRVATRARGRPTAPVT